MKTVLIAVGGNSLVRAGEKGTTAEQSANIQATAAAIVALVRDGFRLVVTHGNGPQVGAALLRSERAADQLPSQPLDVCDACTQGEIGYLLQQSLENELARAEVHLPVVAVLTQVVVSEDDPAMQRPSKPIGPFYSREQADQRRRQLGWEMVEVPLRGFRRVVPSPEPIEIVELEAIRDLVHDGALVIAAGGGGIPVVRHQETLHGIEAVIDKDRASALLALQLGADVLAILTDEDFVYLDYKQRTQRPLTRVTAGELEAYYRAGHFPPGNMGPKVESVLRFLRGGGSEAAITSHERLRDAVAGRTGTLIVAGSEGGAIAKPCAAHAGSDGKAVWGWAMSNLKLVRESLADLQPPRFSDSAWVAPFELLMGAAYALMAAERHGYSRRDGRKYEYHTHVRENIAAVLAEHAFVPPVSGSPLFDDWVSGFYFNAAEQRLVWTADRLLTTFAAMACPCGRPGELSGRGKQSFAEVWKAASLRLEHIGTEHQNDLTYVAVLLKQSAVERHHTCEMAFSADVVLSMLRDHLNHKHGYTLDGHRKTAAGPHIRWSTAAPIVQMEFACAAFSLLCHAYNEMMSWHRDARDRVLTALGELA